MFDTYSSEPLPIYASKTSPPKSYGFHFRPRNRQVNWMKIASLDIDRIIRNGDFHALQENIMDVTFCNIDLDANVRNLEPTFIKLFKLAQLMIEYLLHSQEYLSESIHRLDDKIKHNSKHHEDLQQGLSREQHTIEQLKADLKRKKQLLKQVLQNTNMMSKCPYCEKIFMSLHYLQMHLARRHREVFDSQSNEVFKNMEIETNKIKESLKAAELQLEAERLLRLQHPQQALLDQSQSAISQMENWKTEQLNIYRKEFEDIKVSLLNELKTIISQSTEDGLVGRKTAAYRSQLGFLEDDVEGDSSAGDHEQKHTRIGKITHYLKNQLAEVEENLHRRLELQDQQWQLILKKMGLEQQLQMKQLCEGLEKNIEDLKNQHTLDFRTLSPLDKRKYDDKCTVLDRLDLARSYLPTQAIDFADRKGDSLDVNDNCDIDKVYNILQSSEELSDVFKPEVKLNINVLKGLRQELCGVVDDKLYSWGISPSSKGINNAIYNNKLQAIKTEREKLAKQNNNWKETNEKHRKQIEEIVLKIQRLKSGMENCLNLSTGNQLPILTQERYSNLRQPFVNINSRMQSGNISQFRDAISPDIADDDDVSSTVSSLSVIEPLQSYHRTLKKTSSELSSNTYGTSVWGSSSSKEQEGFAKSPLRVQRESCINSELHLEELSSSDGSDV